MPDTNCLAFPGSPWVNLPTAHSHMPHQYKSIWWALLDPLSSLQFQSFTKNLLKNFMARKMVKHCLNEIIHVWEWGMSLIFSPKIGTYGHIMHSGFQLGVPSPSEGTVDTWGVQSCLPFSCKHHADYDYRDFYTLLHSTSNQSTVLSHFFSLSLSVILVQSACRAPPLCTIAQVQPHPHADDWFCVCKSCCWWITSYINSCRVPLKINSSISVFRIP